MAHALAAIQANPRDPLAYLESIIADPNAKQADRIDAAKAALPYWHSRKATLLAVADVNQQEAVYAALQATFGGIAEQGTPFELEHAPEPAVGPPPARH